jgi:hypothetical protein
MPALELTSRSIQEGFGSRLNELQGLKTRFTPTCHSASAARRTPGKWLGVVAVSGDEEWYDELDLLGWASAAV